MGVIGGVDGGVGSSWVDNKYPDIIYKYIEKYFKDRLEQNYMDRYRTNLVLLERLHDLEVALDRLGIKL